MDTAIPGAKTADDIAAWCVQYLSRNLNIPEAEIPPTAEFDNLGLDSAVTTAMLLDLEDWLGVEVPPSVVFEQTCIRDMAASLAGKA